MIEGFKREAGEEAQSGCDELGCVGECREPGVVIALVSDGSAKPQCAVMGCPGQRGQTSPAALSQTVKMKSILGASGEANSSQLLLRMPAVSQPRLCRVFTARGLTVPDGELPAL